MKLTPRALKSFYRPPSGSTELDLLGQRLAGARVYRSAGSRYPKAIYYPLLPTAQSSGEPIAPRSGGEWWRTLTIIALIVFVVVLLAGGNFLADHLIKGLRDAEQQRIEQMWNKELALRALYAPWVDAHPGQWYTIKWGQREMRIHSKGTLRKLSELPKEGNRAGDFYNIEGQTHFFVWMIPDDASVPTWIDP